MEFPIRASVSNNQQIMRYRQPYKVPPKPMSLPLEIAWCSHAWNGTCYFAYAVRAHEKVEDKPNDVECLPRQQPELRVQFAFYALVRLVQLCRSQGLLNPTAKLQSKVANQPIDENCADWHLHDICITLQCMGALKRQKHKSSSYQLKFCFLLFV